MPLEKPRKDLKILVFVPCHRRHEYTRKCLESLHESWLRSDFKQNTFFYLVNDGTDSETCEIFSKYFCDHWFLFFNKEAKGLRNVILDLFEWLKMSWSERVTADGIFIDNEVADICSSQFNFDFDFVVKMDNDCVAPKNYVEDMLDVFEKSDVDILSPNVFPSDAAHKYGNDVEGLAYIPSSVVGGLWMMRTSLFSDIDFSNYYTHGLAGAIALLKQIIVEKEPKVGWAKNIVVQDIGHWSGEHPEHIKSVEHEVYSHEVGRHIAWQGVKDAKEESSQKGS